MPIQENQWTPLHPRTPEGNHTVVYDPKGKRFLMPTKTEVQDKEHIDTHRIEIWSWEHSETRWKQILQYELSVEECPEVVLLCYDGEHDTVCVYTITERGLCRTWLENPTQSEFFQIPENLWPSHSSVVYDKKHQRTLFFFDGSVWSLKDGKVTVLLEDIDEYPLFVVYNGSEEAPIGQDVYDRLHKWNEDRWEPFGPKDTFPGSYPAYDPIRKTMVKLVNKCAEQMELAALVDRQWQPQSIHFSPHLHSPKLAVHAELGHIMSRNGQDERINNSYTPNTWVSDGTQDFIEYTRPDGLMVGGHITMKQQGESLLLFNHCTMEVSVLEETKWKPLVQPISPKQRRENPAYNKADFRQYMLNFTCSPDAFYVLDYDASVWKSEANGTWQLWTRKMRLSRHFQSYTITFAWDETQDALVLFDGVGQQKTWICKEGEKWQKLPTQKEGPGGIDCEQSGQMLSTPKGPLLLEKCGSLWHFETQTWIYLTNIQETIRSVVEAKESWITEMFFYDARRDALACINQTLTEDYTSCYQLFYLFPSAPPQLAAHLPQKSSLSWTNGENGALGLALKTDRWILCTETTLMTFDVKGADLPEKIGLPNTKDSLVASHSTNSSETNMTKALSIHLAENAQGISLQDLSYTITPPNNARLVAILPLINIPGVPSELHPNHQSRYTGVVVYTYDYDFGEHDWENQPAPWNPGGGLASGQIFHHHEPIEAYISPNETPELYKCDCVPFQEKLNNNGMLMPPQARQSKIGGRPWFLQEQMKATSDKGKPMLFATQLAADLFDCMFGDAGTLYLFIDEEGTEAKAGCQS